MAQVLRGTDIKLGRELALKVLPLPKGETPRAMLARFAEEAQVTAQLAHPNIVPVYDLSLDPNGCPYFSMKLIRGRSLQDILENRKHGDAATLAQFGLQKLIDVFLQVCQAVEYAHARGVIHRDLKPANIMVGDFGEVLVMDWGVAKQKAKVDVSTDESEIAVVDEPVVAKHESAGSQPPPELTFVRSGNEAWATQIGTVIGTPAYMSPEQALGKGVDERTDLYSLGVILYEILCGNVPFDEPDPVLTLARVLRDTPTLPSVRNRDAPLALEALAMRLLEKDPSRRSLTILQIRAHLHNYIEGIGYHYRQASLASSVLRSVGAFAIFAFLIWYLTGHSITTMLGIGPPTVLNAAGWFLLVVALGYPLWAAYVAFQHSRMEHARFDAPEAADLFVSGYLAHRTFAAALAPLFQLLFVVELVVVAISRSSQGAASTDLMRQVAVELRVGWTQALIVVLVFMFGYIFLLSTEVKIARKIDRYELLIRRPAWESVWPVFLVVVLVSTVVAIDMIEWFLSAPTPGLANFIREEVLGRPFNLDEIVKAVVFQGTFLFALMVGAMLLSFPFAELLASLRILYQPADEASVTSRSQYFLRSMAIFRVARANWLYGGAMIGSLTAMTLLGESAARPLVEKILLILVPSLIGFVGYSATQRYVEGYLFRSPEVRRLLEEQVARARHEQRQANLWQLEHAPSRWRLLQLSIPVFCMLTYLIWIGSDLRENAIQGLLRPVTTKHWMLILPYGLLILVLLMRDRVQHWRLRRRA